MGKGISRTLSKAGALAEAAEWLAARDMDELPGYETGHQADIENALPIEDLICHVPTVTDDEVERIKNQDAAQYWVDGYSLIQEKTLKVPIEYARRLSGPSGSAAGNRLEEALVHALNEIFERRAHITVLRNKMVLPTIDIETIENPIIREQIEFVRSKDVEVVLKDLSFGGHLPCVGAYFLDRTIPETFQFHHFFKVGASFNREDALIRNFTEYTQGRRLDEFIQRGNAEEQERILKHDFRALLCVGDTGDNFLSSFMFGVVPYTHADFLREGDLVPFEPGPCFDDCLDDIHRARNICEALDRDLVVVDLTDPDFGFPVVQAIVPGYSDVLPFHPRSSPVLFKEYTKQDVLYSYDRGYQGA
jgi:ribosomal protein S12 methylthiotransferase accessory factor YcaO